jgi:phage FluMu gp28-like protein
VHELLTSPQKTGYVVGPSVDQAAIYFDEIEKAAEQNVLLETMIKGDIIHRPFPKITFINGSVLHGRSTAYDGKYLRGKGADIVAATEAAFIKDKVYHEVIRALVLDRNGKIRLESTPNGLNYFYQLFQQGLSDPSGYYKSFHASVYDNTRISEEEINRIRAEIPDLAFRVEYLAEFVDDDSFVFPWAVLQRCYEEDYELLRKPLPDHRFMIGLDLAKLSDWTVCVVLDVTDVPYRIVDWYRTQHTLYGDIVAHVNLLQATYKAPVWYDATGVGEAVGETINAGNPFVFNQRSRQDLVSRLIMTIEKAHIQLPPSLTVLRDELRYFQHVRRGQSIKAEAAPGHHDDCVMALALAVWGATERRPGAWTSWLIREAQSLEEEEKQLDPVKGDAV